MGMGLPPIRSITQVDGSTMVTKRDFLPRTVFQRGKPVRSGMLRPADSHGSGSLGGQIHRLATATDQVP